jgi:hypothetical protein
VVYWPGKCTEIAAKQFGGLRKGPNLGKFILSLDAGGGRGFSLCRPATQGASP